MDSKRLFKGKMILIALILWSWNPIRGQLNNFQYPTENLNYEIVYHWGMIWKTAATANLSANSHGGNYHIKLVARTTSFADKFYKVRDTLCSVVDKNGFRPLSYMKNTNEGDWQGQDVIKYSYKNEQTIANTTLYRKGKDPVKKVFNAETQAYDFLTIFYAIRSLNYEEMPKNKTYMTYVISGKRKERLYIRMDGKEFVKMRDGKKKEAWKLIFNFTDGSNTKSSDDIYLWVTCDGNHEPLLLLGKIKIGEIRCYLVGN